MKESLSAAGSYLLVGTVVCFALAAVAGNIKEAQPPVESAMQETVEVRAADSKPAAKKTKSRSGQSRKAGTKTRTKKARHEDTPVKSREAKSAKSRGAKSAKSREATPVESQESQD